MRESHEAVITERATPSQTRTIDAARTATYSSVACTTWPPGAQTASATWPAAYSSAVRTSRTWRLSRRRLACRAVSLSGDTKRIPSSRSEEHTSELQSQSHLVCRLLLEKKKP